MPEIRRAQLALLVSEKKTMKKGVEILAQIQEEKGISGDSDVRCLKLWIVNLSPE